MLCHSLWLHQALPCGQASRYPCKCAGKHLELLGSPGKRGEQPLSSNITGKGRGEAVGNSGNGEGMGRGEVVGFGVLGGLGFFFQTFFIEKGLMWMLCPSAHVQAEAQVWLLYPGNTQTLQGGLTTGQQSRDR